MPNSMHHTPHEKLACLHAVLAAPSRPPDTYGATCLFGEYERVLENTEGYERDLYSLIPMLHFAQ
jgi:hypothetical protein